MHNLLTPRGAKVRYPKAFAKAIDNSIDIIEKEWGSNVEAIIGVHHWPTWGNENCMTMLEKQRDMYYFFNNK
jgi:alkyl sulfatase BDS1-like metallo-beta-lactamase superfamily hydrolase